MASQTKAPGPSEQRPKRRQVPLACDKCRARKAKCDGVRPRCSQCTSRNETCDWARETDEPPQAAIKRKYDELERRSASEHEIFDLMQSVPEYSAFRIVAQLREAKDINEVLHFARGLSVDSHNGAMMAARQQNIAERLEFTSSHVEDHRHEELDQREHPTTTFRALGSQVSSRPTLPPISSILSGYENLDARDGAHTSLRRRSPSAPSLPGDIANASRTYDVASARPYDRRLQRAKASDWGITYVNDHDFRMVLSYFFVWDFPFLHWFDEEDFLEGIIYKNSEITSTLTVNVVLAWAARNYGYFDPTVATSVHQAAFEESKRLWSLQLSNNVRSLATAAAGIIMPWLYGANSVDKLGVSCTRHAFKILNEFGLYDERRAKEVYLNAAGRVSRSRAALAWGCYNSASTMEVSWRAGIQLPKPPPVPMPPPSSKRVNDTWTPWPLQEPRFDAHTREVTAARSALYIIVTDMILLQRRFAKNQLSTASLRQTLALNRRFQDWYDKLSPTLTALESTTPQVLILHLLYHQMIMVLFAPLTTHPSSSSPSSIPLLSVQLPLEPAVSAAIMASVQLRHILQRIATLYPTSPLHSNLIPPAMAVAFETAPSASPTSPTYHPSARISFLEAFRLLKRTARTIPLVSFALLGLQQAAIHSKFSLPVEVEHELAEIQRETGGRDKLKSIWVADVRKGASKNDEGRLDALIKGMGEVDLQKDDAVGDGLGPRT